MANAKEHNYRQAKGVWEVRCIIPEEFRDKMPAGNIAQKPTGSIASKIPRIVALVPGTELVDEEFGYLWEVVRVRSYVQAVDSRKQGKAPIVWLKLVALSVPDGIYGVSPKE